MEREQRYFWVFILLCKRRQKGSLCVSIHAEFKVARMVCAKQAERVKKKIVKYKEVIFIIR